MGCFLVSGLGFRIIWLRVEGVPGALSTFWVVFGLAATTGTTAGIAPVPADLQRSSHY